MELVESARQNVDSGQRLKAEVGCAVLLEPVSEPDEAIAVVRANVGVGVSMSTVPRLPPDSGGNVSVNVREPG